MKVCKICKRELDDNQFSKRRCVNNGYGTYCKDCAKVIRNRKANTSLEATQTS